MLGTTIVSDEAATAAPSGMTTASDEAATANAASAAPSGSATATTATTAAPTVAAPPTPAPAEGSSPATPPPTLTPEPGAEALAAETPAPVMGLLTGIKDGAVDELLGVRDVVVGAEADGLDFGFGLGAEVGETDDIHGGGLRGSKSWTF